MDYIGHKLFTSTTITASDINTPLFKVFNPISVFVFEEKRGQVSLSSCKKRRDFFDLSAADLSIPDSKSNI